MEINTLADDDSIEVPWSEVKVTDIDAGSAIGASETRYRIVAGTFDAWYVAYSTNNMSGGEWQDADGTILEDPTHVLITGLPPDVVADAYDVPDDADEAVLPDVLNVITERVDDVYWDAWRERVATAEEALKADLLPYSPTTGSES